MHFSNLVRSIPGQWIIALTSVSLIIAPFGCETLSVFLNDADGRFGWFINEDKTSDLLFGARAPDETSLFAYGAFTESGEIEKVTAVVLLDADGNESFISFDDNGRPVHLQSAGGSYVHIEYTEYPETIVPGNNAHLAGKVQIYTAEDAEITEREFTVDLDKTYADLAAELEQLTGQELEVLPDPNARVVNGAAKAGRRNAETVIFPIFLLPFVVMAYVISYVAAAIVQAVTEMVTAIVAATLIAVLAPIYLLTGVINGILFFPALTLSLAGVFPFIPGFPIWILL